MQLAGAAMMERADEAEKIAGDAGSAPSGRALVRERLIRYLEDLPRPRGVGAEAHARDLDKLAGRLAHMSPGALDGLREWALRLGAGKACPRVGLIESSALAMEPPPPQRSDYAASIIRSRMGREAMDGGYVVELFRHARRYGPPPQTYVIAKLRDEAALNRRRRSDMRALAEAGRLSPDDDRWLTAYWADYDLCRGLQAGPDGVDGEGAAA